MANPTNNSFENVDESGKPLDWIVFDETLGTIDTGIPAYDGTLALRFSGIYSPMNSMIIMSSVFEVSNEITFHARKGGGTQSWLTYGHTATIEIKRLGDDEILSTVTLNNANLTSLYREFSIDSSAYVGTEVYILITFSS
jgi:hypothetical protein